MTKIKFREIIILALSLIVFINFVYFHYVYNGYVHKRAVVVKKIYNYGAKINMNIDKFNNNLNILQKIALIKKEILFSKNNIELLKNSHTTTFDMSNILKTLLVQSGVSIYEVSLSDIRNKNHKNIYSFKVQIDNSLNKILKFMDSIENFSDNMYISNYNLKPDNDKEGIYTSSMVVNFNYVDLRQ